MAYLRGQDRMVYQSFNDYLRQSLTALGWIGTSPFPYGMTTPITFQEFVPSDIEAIAPNTIAITTGEEAADDDAELGCAWGGLWRTERVFFIDVWGESQGISRAIAGDLRGILQGRFQDTGRIIPVNDYTQVPFVAAVGHQLEFTEVVVESPEAQSFKRAWRVVKVMTEHHFNAVEYAAIPTAPGSELHR